MVKVRVTESALLYQHESALCVSKFSDDVITVSLVRVMVDESACYVSKFFSLHSQSNDSTA